MKFEKRFMRMSELKSMGLPGELLDRAYRDPHQKMAMKLNPNKSNSPIIFDTEELGRWWDRQITIQQSAMRRR